MDQLFVIFPTLILSCLPLDSPHWVSCHWEAFSTINNIFFVNLLLNFCVEWWGVCIRLECGTNWTDLTGWQTAIWWISETLTWQTLCQLGPPGLTHWSKRRNVECWRYSTFIKLNFSFPIFLSIFPDKKFDLWAEILV